MNADRLHIEGLRIAAHVGVPDVERAQSQTLRLTLDLDLAHSYSGLDDSLAQTVDYDLVVSRVREIVAEKPRRLIETLAGDIAAGLLSAFSLDAVAVEVQKFILPDCDYVAVRIRRTRAA